MAAGQAGASHLSAQIVMQSEMQKRVVIALAEPERRLSNKFSVSGTATLSGAKEAGPAGRAFDMVMTYAKGVAPTIETGCAGEKPLILGKNGRYGGPDAGGATPRFGGLFFRERCPKLPP